ncbi:SDR family oxidoreductase [Shinella zoogloeoides]|uniref:SDR family oxidoreductase n=1 Tax=Shinella zoogloeoides TaxID=352475 RepID=UPI003C750253
MMDLGLQGKVVVVTGGGSGIGAGITEVLSEEGARPVIVARRAPDADWLRRTGAEFVQAELSDDTACRRAIETVRSRCGAVHGLVNNAGANDGVGIGKGPDAFRDSLNQNLVHYYTMVHLLQDDLRAARGAIVNISSKTALTGQGGTSAYVAAKAAQLGLTREWAVEFLADGVRVNAIVVAEVMTPLYRRWLDTLPDGEAALEEIVRRIPLGQRMTTAREIGDTCAFMLSGRASHMTGQWLFPDGGYTHLDRAIRGHAKENPAAD